MTTSGMLVEVQVLARGSAATAAVAAGGTVVPVEDVTQFDDQGGTVQIDGAAYDYLSVDEDASTLTLASPLSSDVVEFDPVLVMAGGQVVQDWTAVVDFGGEGDVVSVPIPYGLRSVLGEGQYDPPVPVDVADNLSTVLDVPGRTPVIDGGMIDPSTFPAVPPPTDPPAASPTLTVTPLNTTLVVTASDVDQTTTINYYVSTTDGFTPDASTLVLSTRSTAVAIDQLADGTPLEQGVTYYLVAVASNVVGSAAPSPQVSGVLATSKVTITADDVIGGTFTSAYDVTGSLTIGNITIDPNNGLEIPLASGGIIQFPADGSAATLQAHLDALSITVQDNLTINGVHNDVAGTVALDNVPVAPTVEPQTSLVTLTTGAGYQLSGSLAGYPLIGALVNTATAFIVVAYNAVPAYPLISIDKASGATTTLVADLSAKLPSGSTLDAVAYDGTNWYVLYARSNLQQYVRVFNASWSQTADYSAGGIWSQSGAGAITYDAASGNVLIAGSPNVKPNVGQLVMVVRDAATGTFVDQIAYPVYPTWPPSAVITGSMDFGSPRTVFVFPSGVGDGVVFPAYTAASPAVEFTENRFRSTTVGVAGATWDGTNFWYLLSNANVIYDLRKLAPVPAAQSRSVTWTQYCDASRTGSTGPYETKPSPAATISQAARSWLRVTVPAPNDGGGPNDPNRSRVYVANHLQGALSGGGTATYGAPTTTGQAAPTVEGFVSATGGSLGTIQSQAVGVDGKPAIQLKGDGSSKIGGASTPIAGTGGMQFGTTVVSMGGGASATGHIDFPNAFGAPPMVFVNLATAVGNKLVPGVNSGTPPTTTGFDWTIKTGDGTTSSAGPTLYWFAIGAA